MSAISPGSPAPPVPGMPFDRPKVLFFYKVTCPVCQLAAPAVQTFERAYPGGIAGVGQDPPDRIEDFSGRFGVGFPSVSDASPYPISDAYGIEVVPTTFLIDGEGTVVDAVESWDREGLNRVSRGLAELTGAAYSAVSEAGDGLPPFRPG